jgi:predicted Fe-Mo cluster-binding NifX family protein
VDGATVSVAVVASRTEAELIVGMLRGHGVSAAVSADDAGGQYPQLQADGVRVLVAPADEASARRDIYAPVIAQQLQAALADKPQLLQRLTD